MTHRISKFFLLSCLLIAAWGTSGTVGWSVLAMFALSSFAFLSTLWDKSGEPLISRASWTKNPFLLPGLILVFANLVQLVNPSIRVCEYYGYQTVMFLKHIDFLPSGIVRDWGFRDTLFVLLQLTSAWYVAMSSWKLLRSGHFARFFIKFFAVNGVLVALLGVIQEITLAKGIYWIIPTNSHFYSSFYLRSNAGDFMFAAFMCCLSWGVSSYNRRSYLQVISSILCALICVYSCLLTRSSGVLGILSISLLCFSIFFIWELLTLKLSRLVSFVCISAFLIFAVLVITMQPRLMRVFDSELNSAYMSMKPRLNLMKTSCEVFESSPLLGVGAGAYGVSAEILSPTEKYFGQTKAFINSAHNDFFEYLCEYGVFGLVSIVLCLFMWFFRLNRRTWSIHNTIFLWTCLMFMLHSLVDMPLHIPSTMFVFVFMMSLAAANFRKAGT